MNRRDRIEILVDLFGNIQKHPRYSQTHILAITNVNYQQWFRELKKLNHQGFIKKHPQVSGSTLSLTDKGREWLKKAKLLIYEIKGNTLDSS